jgi:ribosomal protein S18 acetylase RimI-like enzyme
MRPADARAVAEVHAASWQDTYRGILAGSYLDGPLLADRQRLWRERLVDKPAPLQIGLLALDGETAVGFAYARPGSHARWGTLLENLHVLPAARGRGIGRMLLHALSGQLEGGLFLWVFERNTRARALYERLGGERIERAEESAPGGGVAAAWMYAWRDVAQLHRVTGKGS